MASFLQILNGTKNFIDSEIIPKINGEVSKFATKVIVDMKYLQIRNNPSTFLNLPFMEQIKKIDIINFDDLENIDIDDLFPVLKNIAEKENLKISLPIGTLKLNGNDFEKLYKYINES